MTLKKIEKLLSVSIVSLAALALTQMGCEKKEEEKKEETTQVAPEATSAPTEAPEATPAPAAEEEKAEDTAEEEESDSK